MAERTGAAAQLERRARHSTALEWCVRAGLVAYGTLHLLLAWVALSLVLGHDAGPSGNGSGSATGQGALAQLAADTLGRVLLAAMAILFGGLAVWQLIAGLVGYRKDEGWKRHAMRFGAGCRVIAYAYFAVAAARFAAEGTQTSRESPSSTTGKLLDAPAGAFLVVAGGVVTASIGIGLAVFGLRKGFVDQLDSRARTSARRSPIVVLGQLGYVVKGLAFVVIGLLLTLAAVTRDPGKTGGLDESLYELLGHAIGSIAVVVVGLGIGCFGLYLFARSWHLDEDSLTS